MLGQSVSRVRRPAGRSELGGPYEPGRAASGVLLQAAPCVRVGAYAYPVGDAVPVGVGWREVRRAARSLQRAVCRPSGELAHGGALPIYVAAGEPGSQATYVKHRALALVVKARVARPADCARGTRRALIRGRAAHDKGVSLGSACVQVGAYALGGWLTAHKNPVHAVQDRAARASRHQSVGHHIVPE